jgi:hypothetical protein
MDLKFSRIVFFPTFFFLTNARAMVVWHGPQILAHSVFPYEFLFDKKKATPTNGGGMVYYNLLD